MTATETLSIRASGPDDGPALVFLHGFMGRKEDWVEVVSLLDDTFRCFCVDLPFHGESRSIQAGFDETIALILRRLDGLWRRRIGLVGYSMGGRIALQLALHHAERVTRCVIESGSPGLMLTGARETRCEQDDAMALELEGIAPGDQGAFEDFLHRWYRADLWASLREDPARLEALIATRGAHNDPAALAGALRALGTGRQPSQWAALSSAQTPMLYVAGERDGKFRHIAAEMYAHTPSLKIATVANCGHNVHLEKPGEYAAVIRDFFS
jgi:2-succinyl-6-hydroxy-2,4-cyclohexadiene-1-carboxylate synthase